MWRMADDTPTPPFQMVRSSTRYVGNGPGISFVLGLTVKPGRKRNRPKQSSKLFPSVEWARCASSSAAFFFSAAHRRATSQGFSSPCCDESSVVVLVPSEFSSQTCGVRSKPPGFHKISCTMPISPSSSNKGISLVSILTVVVATDISSAVRLLVSLASAALETSCMAFMMARKNTCKLCGCFSLIRRMSSGDMIANTSSIDVDA
mmetsp:Transcript_65104/g.136379  ORF Transcript_65104/g.136379 Transcript_65104/m.136379 type:complete len:205 (+) Transcript_65104:194-808(+)